MRIEWLILNSRIYVSPRVGVYVFFGMWLVCGCLLFTFVQSFKPGFRRGNKSRTWTLSGHRFKWCCGATFPWTRLGLKLRFSGEFQRPLSLIRPHLCLPAILNAPPLLIDSTDLSMAVCNVHTYLGQWSHSILTLFLMFGSQWFDYYSFDALWNV